MKGSVIISLSKANYPAWYICEPAKKPHFRFLVEGVQMVLSQSEARGLPEEVTCPQRAQLFFEHASVIFRPTTCLAGTINWVAQISLGLQGGGQGHFKSKAAAEVAIKEKSEIGLREAIEQCERVLPKNTITYARGTRERLSNLYFCLGNVVKKAGRLEEALSCFHQSEKYGSPDGLDTDILKGYFSLGNEAIEANNSQLALSFFERFIKLKRDKGFLGLTEMTKLVEEIIQKIKSKKAVLDVQKEGWIKTVIATDVSGELGAGVRYDGTTGNYGVLPSILTEIVPQNIEGTAIVETRQLLVTKYDTMDAFKRLSIDFGAGLGENLALFLANSFAETADSMTDQEISLVTVMLRVTASKTVVSSSSISPAHEVALATNPDEFYLSYGTDYIQGIRKGACVFATVRLKSEVKLKTSELFGAVMGNFSAFGTGGNLSLEVSAKQKEEISRSIIDVQIRGIGIDRLEMSIEEVEPESKLKSAKRVLTNVHERFNSGDLGVVAYQLAPWSRYQTTKVESPPDYEQA